MAISETEALAIRPNVYYTIEEAAALLRVPRASVRRLSTERGLGIRIGRHWRVLGAALLGLSRSEDESEAAHIAYWLAASERSLREVWDNDEDAVYDTL